MTIGDLLAEIVVLENDISFNRKQHYNALWILDNAQNRLRNIIAKSQFIELELKTKKAFNKLMNDPVTDFEKIIDNTKGAE